MAYPSDGAVLDLSRRPRFVHCGCREGLHWRGKIKLALLLTMLPDIDNLLLLQEADREIRRWNDEVAALPKRVGAIEAKLTGINASLNKAKAAIKADDAARRKLETDIHDRAQ